MASDALHRGLGVRAGPTGGRDELAEVLARPAGGVAERSQDPLTQPTLGEQAGGHQARDLGGHPGGPDQKCNHGQARSDEVVGGPVEHRGRGRQAQEGGQEHGEAGQEEGEHPVVDVEQGESEGADHDGEDGQDDRPGLQ
jgi:hypothetical protein